MRTSKRTRPVSRRGFSLIEVLLATAVLMGAMAVLGELAHLGYRNARNARAYMTAQVLCEAKLNEIVCGQTPAEEVTETPFETEPQWLYAVLATPQDQPGLISVQVTVRENLPEEKRPISVSLSRLLSQATPSPHSSDSNVPAVGAPAFPPNPALMWD